MATPLRIGLSSHTSLINRRLNDMRTRMMRIETQSLTGLKLIDPSDMPGAIQETDAIAAALQDQDSFLANATSAVSIQDMADTALDEAHNLVARAKELALVGSTETTSTEQRNILATEIDSLISQIVALGNTRVGDRYVFAGQDYLNRPFAEDGSYSGHDSSVSTRVGEDAWTELGWSGQDIFKEGEDVTALLGDLAVQLRADDADGVFNLLDRFDTAGQQLIEAREHVGLATQQAENAREVAENLSVRLVERQDALVGVDPYESMADLVNLRTTFQSAVQVSATTSRINLFQYLS